MKVYAAGTSNGLTTDFSDEGNLRKVIKPTALEQWARNMELSNNVHDDDIALVKASVVALDTRQREMDNKIQVLNDFMVYVAQNYPHITHEYDVAQKAKARMETDDQPVTMGP